jgi:hypothetical protein
MFLFENLLPYNDFKTLNYVTLLLVHLKCSVSAMLLKYRVGSDLL